MNLRNLLHFATFSALFACAPTELSGPSHVFLLDAPAMIPIIDAHSQADQYVELEEIIRLMDKGGVSRTILAARGKLKKGIR